MPASRTDRFTHGDWTQAPTEQREEQTTESVPWKRDNRQVLGNEPQLLRRTAQFQYNLPGFLLSIMRHFNRRARTVHVRQKH